MSVPETIAAAVSVDVATGSVWLSSPGRPDWEV